MTKKSIIVCDICRREISNTYYWEMHRVSRSGVPFASDDSHMCPDCWAALGGEVLEQRKEEDVARGGVVGPFPMGL